MNGDGAAKRAPAAAYYECTFCKRGFTNAQALGGHMNIHRKDRGGSGGKSQGSGQQLEGGSGGGQQHGRDVHLGLTLGRDEEDGRDGVDLELRLGHAHYP
uniref:C2H2-type domain-containing protein n=1 Tax=Leersia perrieri TaxID=77586 RepID=A0A0D9WXZ8_9ORYZ